MFIHDSSHRFVDPRSGTITSVVESINQPLVAVPGKPSQHASAVAVGLRHGTEFEVLIFLHLSQDNEGVIYAWDDGPVPIDVFREVEAEAVAFLESMGFMVDSLNWDTMTPEQRAETMGRLPAFHEDLSAFRAGGAHESTGPHAEVDAKLLDLARLMAAF